MGSKFSRHFFKQSEVKPKPIVARAGTFSRALCRLRVITSSFDWFTGLSPSFLIGKGNYFGFGFTTLIETLNNSVVEHPNGDREAVSSILAKRTKILSECPLSTIEESTPFRLSYSSLMSSVVFLF